MANNYTQFSFTIALEKPEHVQWWRTVRELTYDDDYTEQAWSALGIEANETPEYAPCSIDVEADGSEVWLWTDESGSDDDTARLVHQFLRQFDIANPVSFEVAFSCSKPRPGEFGGAAYWITEEHYEGYGTCLWLAEKYQTHAKGA